MRLIITQMERPSWPFATPPKMKRTGYDLTQSDLGTQYVADRGWFIVAVYIAANTEDEVAYLNGQSRQQGTEAQGPAREV